jgi:hypothetical protein
MRSTFGPLCGSDAVSSSIILFYELRMGETTQGGERNFTIYGMKEKGVSTDAGRIQTQRTRTQQNCNRLINVL